MVAWSAHEQELRAWLLMRLGNRYDAEDVLQTLFLKALRQDRKFCDIDNARAWLFEVARNTLADRLRAERALVELPEELPEVRDEPAAVDSLAVCLPNALAALSAEDREAVTLCDLEGMGQAEYARLNGLTLPAAKSRVQRARRRLRERMQECCQVRFDESGQVCCFVPRSPAD